MPQLWTIAGLNSAGNTTLADRWFATRIPVISPDSIAATQGLSAVQSAKTAIREQEHLLVSGQSFAIDTTCSGKRALAVMKKARETGFKVNLMFVGVESLALCQARIHERIASGGDAVPPEDVARRFVRTLANLPAAIAERAFIVDNTGEKRRLLLSVEHGRIKHLSQNLPSWAQQAIPTELIRARDPVLER